MMIMFSKINFHSILCISNNNNSIKSILFKNFATKKSTSPRRPDTPLLPASKIDINELTNLNDRNIPSTLPTRPCSIFYDRTLAKFINRGTRKGQRVLMSELMRETFMLIKLTQLKKLNSGNNIKENDDDDSDNQSSTNQIVCDPLIIFHGALKNCMPLIITKPVKRGGATYQVPFPISEKESEELAMRWLHQTVVERPRPRKQHFPEVMARELIDCYYNQGKVVKKKQDIHRQCENNKAYAHYRWG